MKSLSRGVMIWRFRSQGMISDEEEMKIEKKVINFLSFTPLIGLPLNYLFGLWQADPIIGFIIVLYLFKEGYMTLKEEKLCSC